MAIQDTFSSKKVFEIAATTTIEEEMKLFPVIRRSPQQKQQLRRRFLLNSLVGSFLSPLVAARPQQSNAADHRELALCLVSLLRIKFWAQSLTDELKEYRDDEERVKELYLETRLGAKAAITGRIGGGSNMRVFNVASLKFRETLDDLAWHANKTKNTRVVQLKDDLIESLASLVEFDGLESTQDPSPRSELTLSMFNSKKLNFVIRTLQERILPTADSLFNEFDSDTKSRCLDYAKTNYSSEMPKQRSVASASPNEPS